MIDCFLGNAFEVLSCMFWKTVLHCGAQLPIHTLHYWTVSQWYPLSNCGVFECDIAHLRSVAVLCMLYKIRCNPMNLLFGVLPVLYVIVLVTRGALVAHRHTIMSFFATEPRSTAGPLFPSQSHCETILLTLYSMVWDWQV